MAYVFTTPHFLYFLTCTPSTYKKGASETVGKSALAMASDFSCLLSLDCTKRHIE